MNSTSREVAKLDAAMAAKPPRIVWQVNSRGIQIAVQVEDPYPDMEPRGRTRCKAGHLFDEVNTIPRSDGDRDCRECKRRRNREYAARRRQRECEVAA